MSPWASLGYGSFLSLPHFYILNSPKEPWWLVLQAVPQFRFVWYFLSSLDWNYMDFFLHAPELDDLCLRGRAVLKFQFHHGASRGTLPYRLSLLTLTLVWGSIARSLHYEIIPFPLSLMALLWKSHDGQAIVKWARITLWLLGGTASTSIFQSWWAREMPPFPLDGYTLVYNCASQAGQAFTTVSQGLRW